MEVYGVVKFAVDNVLSQKSAEFHESRFVCRHFILHCPKYDSERSRLIDIAESLWHNVKVGRMGAGVYWTAAKNTVLMCGGSSSQRLTSLPGR